ncbi:hypothetical protein KEJ26_00685 [Candidatus Bathyarchaeota archaeon]|nr:hypothetical protein [Candidatus Bathyarchaeota archaeon]
MQIGEVIAGSLSRVDVQVQIKPKMEWPIVFGSFVKVKAEGFDIIGIITDIYYEPLEGRRPRPRWLEEKAVLDRIYPDIHEKFLSIAEVVVLGYAMNEQLNQDLPPTPPSVHSAVTLMSDREILKFHEIDLEGTRVKLDYVYRIIEELKPGRCIDLLKAIVDKLETFKLPRNVVVGEITSIYLALGEEKVIPMVSSRLAQGK